MKYQSLWQHGVRRGRGAGVREARGQRGRRARPGDEPLACLLMCLPPSASPPVSQAHQVAHPAKHDQVMSLLPA